MDQFLIKLVEKDEERGVERRRMVGERVERDLEVETKGKRYQAE